jgi:hypothetical protein
MDEFAALAQRVVLTMDDVRGCLVLSRDGMVLGAFPDDQEAELKPAWLRFTHVGEARKGFVEFSDQLWAFVHRGPYAAFVVTGTSVRPGVMLDQLEQAVIAAEEARAKQKEITLKVPDAASAPSGRPRTSLHPPADRAPAPAVAPAAAAEGEEMPTFAAPVGAAEEAAPPAGEWDGATPEQREQMEAMRQQMAAMQAQIEQQALQAAPPTAAPPAGAPAGGQPISGYRRPETAPAPAPAAAADPAPTPGPDLSGRARPSIEGSPYEAVLADDASTAPRPFSAESSPFARLEAEQAQAAAEGATPAARSSEQPAAAPFRSEPQRLASAEAPADAPAPEPAAAGDQEEAGEVDRVMLAKEFSGLLQVDGDGDEE